MFFTYKSDLFSHLHTILQTKSQTVDIISCILIYAKFILLTNSVWKISMKATAKAINWDITMVMVVKVFMIISTAMSMSTLVIYPAIDTGVVLNWYTCISVYCCGFLVKVITEFRSRQCQTLYILLLWGTIISVWLPVFLNLAKWLGYGSLCHLWQRRCAGRIRPTSGTWAWCLLLC